MINGVSGKTKIVDAWKCHYDKLLNLNGNCNGESLTLDDIAFTTDNIQCYYFCSSQAGH